MGELSRIIYHSTYLSIYVLTYLSVHILYCSAMLQEKVKFTAATGRKDIKENYAYLPTTISDFDEHGNIKYSQWNYNILCHPLKKDVPLTRFVWSSDTIYVQHNILNFLSVVYHTPAHTKVSHSYSWIPSCR